MRATAVLVLAVSWTAAAPVPKELKKPDDAKQLQGRWRSVTLDGGGGHQPNTSYWLIVEDGKLWMGAGTPTKQSTEYTFTLDPTQSPKHLNLSSTPHGQQNWIYQLDGDTLTWCHPAGGNDRPTGMKSAKPYYCTVWERVKE